MNREIEIGREEFLKLSTEEIHGIVQQKNSPRVGIFVADGNRRLVMCQTGLSPTSEEFYQEYARFFVDSLKKSLTIFFDHGLETLFFPLFGPSLLLRQNKFQSITIPAAYQKIFQSDEWFQFYKENRIRVKAYGEFSQLEKIDIKHLSFAKGIHQTIQKTASHDKHTLFFGFMSENTPGLEMPKYIIDFYKSHNRPPTSGEMLEIYYGETISPADFIIFSEKLSNRALPPFISNQRAIMYFLPIPGFLGLNALNYRRILYDLLYIQHQDSIPEYSDDDYNNIEPLNKFYQQHKNTIIGTGKRIGKFLIPDI
jgi:hypothetical protein